MRQAVKLVVLKYLDHRDNAALLISDHVVEPVDSYQTIAGILDH